MLPLVCSLCRIQHDVSKTLGSVQVQNTVCFERDDWGPMRNSGVVFFYLLHIFFWHKAENILFPSICELNVRPHDLFLHEMSVNREENLKKEKTDCFSLSYGVKGRDDQQYLDLYRGQKALQPTSVTKLSAPLQRSVPACFANFST